MPVGGPNFAVMYNFARPHQIGACTRAGMHSWPSPTTKYTAGQTGKPLDVPSFVQGFAPERIGFDAGPALLAAFGRVRNLKILPGRGAGNMDSVSTRLSKARAAGDTVKDVLAGSLGFRSNTLVSVSASQTLSPYQRATELRSAPSAR